MQNPRKVQQAAKFIRETLSRPHPARLGLVLGTGLSGAAGELEILSTLPYAGIPGFPQSTAPSHAGSLSSARLGGVPAWVLSGRFHLYEGYSPAEVAGGVRTLAALGVDTLVLTNAAGALNPQFDAGALMAVTDHLNCTGLSPLTGPNHEEWGERFPDMSRVYDPDLVRLALDCAARLDIRLERGVYAGVCGPQLETPAETRALRILGADAVGMSTVLEAIAARHLGLKVLALSCLTNKNLPDCMAPVTLDGVLATAAAAASDLGRLLSAVAAALPQPE
ncbi:MAG: purine-nucleoside phosphorylase [Thermodesulfobacteriota bacterium]